MLMHSFNHYNDPLLILLNLCFQPQILSVRHRRMMALTGDYSALSLIFPETSFHHPQFWKHFVKWSGQRNYIAECFTIHAFTTHLPGLTKKMWVMVNLK